MDIVERVRQKMRGWHRDILICAPTGSGKTVLVAYMMKGAAAKGRTSWLICHRRELVHQTVSTLVQAGVSPAIVAAGADTGDPCASIVVASLQTISRRLKSLKPPGMIVWDECHHIAATSWSRVKEWAKNAHHVGLTATPARLDGTGLKKWFTSMVMGPTVRELIDQGYLSEYRIYAPFMPHLGGLKTKMGDWMAGDLADVMSTPTITGSAIEHYQRLCAGKRAMAFCANIAHSKRVASDFNNAGIPALHIDGETKKNERDEALRRFHSGDILLISNCILFGEGLDIPGIEAIISLRPTQSSGLYLQQVGRGLRPAPGKEYAVILDHAGNAARHGLPCDAREWTLEGHRRRAGSATTEVASARICTTCFGANPAGSMVCRYCDTKFPIEQRRLSERSGELVEVDKKLAAKKRRAAQARCRTFNELVAYSRSLGHKNPHGYAYFVTKARKEKEDARRRFSKN